MPYAETVSNTTILKMVTMLPTVPVSDAPRRLTYMNKITTSTALILIAKFSAFMPSTIGVWEKETPAHFRNSTKNVPKMME